MWKKLGRLFVIKTRWEAWAVIYAIALGASDRGLHYVDQYDGWIGWIFFAACVSVVFMVGGRLLDMTRRDAGPRRRKSDFVGAY
jgi:hypothetical protein